MFPRPPRSSLDRLFAVCLALSSTAAGLLVILVHIAGPGRAYALVHVPQDPVLASIPDRACPTLVIEGLDDPPRIEHCSVRAVVRADGTRVDSDCARAARPLTSSQQAAARACIGSATSSAVVEWTLDAGRLTQITAQGIAAAAELRCLRQTAYPWTPPLEPAR